MKMADTRHCSLRTTSCCTKLLIKSFLTILIFVQLQANVSGVIYESVRWISKNPRFMVGTEHQNCKEDEVSEIRVAVGSKITFICPTSVMVLETIQHDIPKESLYENLWIVYDERSFNTCTVAVPNQAEASKYLLACDDHNSLKYWSIIFNIYSASDHLAFPDEKYYYFFSTSDGTIGSLNNTAHGHCNDTKEKVAMKFRLLVCKEGSSNPKCNDTNFPFGKFRCVSGRTGDPAPTPSPSASPTQTPPVVLPATYSQPNTAITTTSPVSKDPSGDAPKFSKRSGSKDKSMKWQVTAGFFIFLSGILLVALVHHMYFKHGKSESCFCDLIKVGCLSTSKNDKHKNSDGGSAEKGNVMSNCVKDAEFRKSKYGEEQETNPKISLYREKSVRGHKNHGYQRESVSEMQHQNSTEVRKEGKTEDYGESNKGFDVEDGSKSKIVPDVNTNTRIESSVKGDRGDRYEMLLISPKGLEGKNLINSGGKEVKVKADKSPVIENNVPNGTPRSKIVDVRACVTTEMPHKI